MQREIFEFDPVQMLTAGAVGVPGQRTFFILAAQGRRWVRVWLEKQQLQALADAIGEFILALPDEQQPTNAPDAPEASDPSDTPAAEFRAESLALGYDEDQRLGSILVNEGDSSPGAPVLRCWASLAQLQGFARRASQVCAAGRPPCPLCGLPMDPDGHICPRTNGHHPAFHRP